MLSWTARYGIAVTAIGLAQFAFGGPAQLSSIRFDGVYQTRVQPPPGWGLKPLQELFLYFRFYSDGSVVAALSTGTPTDVAKFLRPHLEVSGDGFYSISGDRVKLRLVTRRGEIDYWGRIGRDSLQLFSYSHVSNSRDARQYKFFPVRFAK